MLELYRKLDKSSIYTAFYRVDIKVWEQLLHFCTPVLLQLYCQPIFPAHIKTCTSFVMVWRRFSNCPTWLNVSDSAVSKLHVSSLSPSSLVVPLTSLLLTLLTLVLGAAAIKSFLVYRRRFSQQAGQFTVTSWSLCSSCLLVSIKVQNNQLITLTFHFIVLSVINKIKLISSVEEIENYFSALESKQDINIFPASLSFTMWNSSCSIIFFSGMFQSSKRRYLFLFF